MTQTYSQFAIPGFDLNAFVAATLGEDLGVGLPGGGHDVTAESVIAADARFSGIMESRDAIVVAGLPIAEAFFRQLDPDMGIEFWSVRAKWLRPVRSSCACLAVRGPC